MENADDQTRYALPLEERLQGARRFCDEMLQWLKGRRRILIVVHDNPDPDCLASALALSRLFTATVNIEPVISFSGMIGRSENLIMAGLLESPLVPLEIINPEDYEVVCMLDTQPATGNNSLDPAVPVHIVIDHHPLRERSKACQWVDVREDYGVTATILYEYLTALDVPIDTKLATAIFYAIKSDTQDLGREANLPDREAYLQLFPLADKQLLWRITNPRQPVEYFRTVRETIARARIYGSVIVADMERIAFPELLAEMADLLLKMENIVAVIAVGAYGGELLISARTAVLELNAGEIMKRVVCGLGTGGGHALMAGGKVTLSPDDRERASETKRLVVERFLAATGAAGETPVSI